LARPIKGVNCSCMITRLQWHVYPKWPVIDTWTSHWNSFYNIKLFNVVTILSVESFTETHSYVQLYLVKFCLITWYIASSYKSILMHESNFKNMIGWFEIWNLIWSFHDLSIKCMLYKFYKMTCTWYSNARGLAIAFEYSCQKLYGRYLFVYSFQYWTATLLFMQQWTFMII